MLCIIPAIPSLLASDTTRPYPPLFDAFGAPGNDTLKCSGAQIVCTNSSLLVWGICGGGAGLANRSVYLRRSTDWGGTWSDPIPQPHLGGKDLAQFIYNPGTGAILSMAPPPAPEGGGGGCTPSPLCSRPYSCASVSYDDGETWSAPHPAGCLGNASGGSGEGCSGITLSTGRMLSPAGFGPGNRVIFSSDGGRTWQSGGATPPLPSSQGWGEAAVAELANGSVVLTSRLKSFYGHWQVYPLQRAFSISHDGATTWEKSWAFPAAQPFGVGFGPGYNVENGLASADRKTKLLLSKPTATLHGDSSGSRPRCGPHTQGSCPYRRNLTVAVSGDGGASWAIEPWGLIYEDRAAYSDLVELPDGRVAVVFERSNSSEEEYRYVSVAIVTPHWAMHERERK